MMQFIRALYNAWVNPVLLRAGVFPTAATGAPAAAVTLTAAAAAWTFGVYAQIVAAVGVLTNALLVGFTLENFTGVASQGEVIIAIGPAGFEVEIGRFQVTTEQMVISPPLKLPLGTRIAASYRTSTGAADTVDIKLQTRTL